MRSPYPRTAVLADAVCILASLAVAAAFAFRTGVPGFRHDWLWPMHSSTFVRRLLETGFSQWNPHGIGSGGQVPSLNLPMTFLAFLGLLHVPSGAILFTFLFAIYCAAAIGLARCISAFDIALDPASARIVAIVYALNPICFQKTVAGHLWWLAAYAALPWFALNVRLGCVRAAQAGPRFAAAALLFALASTQIQFLFFDAVVLACIVAPFVRERRAWLGSAAVLAAGALHNAMWFVIPLAPIFAFDAIPSHATLEWENDMSGFALPLWLFSGYNHYDDAALSGWTVSAFAFGRVALAITATAALFARPNLRTATFGAIAVFALAIAAGLHGPLAPILDNAILRDNSFLFLREFFHVMALYAFAAAMLAALALARVPWPGVRIGVAALTLPCILPFATGGLGALVPNVSLDPAENEAGFYLPHLRALLPFQEPIGVPDDPHAGLDPARLADDVVTTDNTPPYVYEFLSKGAAGSPLLADLGVSSVSPRAERESKISTSFEPHVGARFEGFQAREASLHAAFGATTNLPDPRSLVQLQTSDPETVASHIAGVDIPAGRNVPIESSRVGNDIDDKWVSGHLWIWVDPDTAGVAADPVITRSRAPLVLDANVKVGDSLYVLARGPEFRLDGSLPDGVAGSDPNDYRWWRWDIHVPRIEVSLVGDGEILSVDRAIVTRNAEWRPTPVALETVAPPQTLPYSANVPWQIELEAPQRSSPRVLVFARSFSQGWHLFLDGSDLGPPRRVDGIFNGWTIAPGPAARASLEFVPQRFANAALILTAVVEGALLLLALSPIVVRLRGPVRRRAAEPAS
jgi:hypothetical protein